MISIYRPLTVSTPASSQVQPTRAKSSLVLFTMVFTAYILHKQPQKQFELLLSWLALPLQVFMMFFFFLAPVCDHKASGLQKERLSCLRCAWTIVKHFKLFQQMWLAVKDNEAFLLSQLELHKTRRTQGIYVHWTALHLQEITLAVLLGHSCSEISHRAPIKRTARTRLTKHNTIWACAASS